MGATHPSDVDALAVVGLLVEVALTRTIRRGWGLGTGALVWTFFKPPKSRDIAPCRPGGFLAEMLEIDDFYHFHPKPWLAIRCQSVPVSNPFPVQVLSKPGRPSCPNGFFSSKSL